VRFLLPVLILAAAAPTFAQTTEIVRIVHDDAPALSAELRSRGFDVLPPTVAGAVDLGVSPSDKQALQHEGFALQVLSVGRPLRELLAERGEEAGRADAIPGGYPDLPGIYARMAAAAANYPSICKLVDLTATYGTPPTEEGRHLFAVKISDNVDVDEDEPSFLIVTTHHAREINTVVVGLEAIDRFTQNYASVPLIQGLVDEYEIWISPMWNPDGFVYVYEVDNNWRKNRRDNGNGTFGVDLNRNYPFGWGSTCSGTGSTGSETYRGPFPASEAEPQTMVAWGADRRFTKVFDFHSFASEVRYGYGCFSHPLNSWLQSEASSFSQAGGYGGQTASSCCTAGNIHWHGANTGSHAFLWEIGTSFQPSYASALSEATQLFGGIVSMAERPIPLWGHVTDACSGAPLAAALEFTTVNYVNGEVNGSGGAFGRYQAFLPAGNYTAVFQAEGYADQSVPVAITANGSVQLDVAMVPLSATANYCTAGTSASGCQVVLTSLGTPSATAPSGFTLSGVDVEGNKDGLFFFGTNGRQANGWGTSSSFQCVAPPVKRGGLLVGSGSVGACDGVLSQDLSARWTAKPNQNPGAGAVVQAQLWYRDPQSTSGQNTSLSDAVEFVVCP